MDPTKIEKAISGETTAILPVHCYGNPCDIESIDFIASAHGLRVVYDAAHAFGVNCHCGSLLNHGDFSAVSFHATKVFNTFEGGALVSRNVELKQKVDRLRNFGISDEITVEATGINAKMSEISAAMGLLQLAHINKVIELRKAVATLYQKRISNISGIKLLVSDGVRTKNYSYFPILVQDDYPLSRTDLFEKLKSVGIFTRRYFFPLISDFPMYKSLPSASPENLPVATAMANKVLCLPIYPELRLEDQLRVIDALERFSR